MSDLSQRKKAIVLGAGPVGLVTAWELLKNDWSVSVYEKANIVGGMCRTWKWDDFLVDTGPHIFHTPDKNLDYISIQTSNTSQSVHHRREVSGFNLPTFRGIVPCPKVMQTFF